MIFVCRWLYDGYYEKIYCGIFAALVRGISHEISGVIA